MVGRAEWSGRRTVGRGHGQPGRRSGGRTDWRADGRWMGGQSVGRTDARAGGWTSGRNDERAEGWAERWQMDGREDRRTVGLADRRADSWSDGRMSGRSDRRWDGRMDGRSDGRAVRQMAQQTVCWADALSSLMYSRWGVTSKVNDFAYLVELYLPIYLHMYLPIDVSETLMLIISLLKTKGPRIVTKSELTSWDPSFWAPGTRIFGGFGV